MKVKWALCKKEDLGKFKADLQGHTGSIEVLLLTVQMYDSNLSEQDTTYRSPIGMLQLSKLANVIRLTKH